MVDLSPLQAVYEQFQAGQSASVVIRRRYQPGGTSTGILGLMSRGGYAEVPVDVFMVPPSKTRTPTETGADGNATETIYSTTDFLTTDSPSDQAADVVFMTDGRAFEVVAVNDWRQANGCEVTIRYTGRVKGQRPFDA